MDLRELRYFLAVYETGSVTAAARRCFVSQPSISAAIVGLERQLKTTLFIRHPKGVAATAAADTLHDRARRLVDEAAALQSLFAPPPLDTVTLGLMRSLDIRRTLSLVRPLAESSDLRLCLVDASDPCDARIVARVSATDDEAFLPLWSEAYVLALPARHDLCLKARVTLADLRDARMIARCHCEYADLAATVGFKPDIAAIATSEDWAVALVRAGVGVVVAPEGVIPADPDIAVRPIIDLDLRRDVGIAYRKSDASAPSVRRILETLGEAEAPRRRRALLGGRAA